MTILLPKSQMCNYCSSHSRQDSHLINSNPPHKLQTREQEPRQKKRERHTSTWKEGMCPLHAFTMYEGRETDDSEEAGQGLKKKSNPHKRTSRPTQARRCWSGGSVIDVPCDWSLRHAHIETTPRPSQGSRQSKREAGGLG